MDTKQTVTIRACLSIHYMWLVMVINSENYYFHQLQQIQKSTCLLCQSPLSNQTHDRFLIDIILLITILDLETHNVSPLVHDNIIVDPLVSKHVCKNYQSFNWNLKWNTRYWSYKLFGNDKIISSFFLAKMSFCHWVILKQHPTHKGTTISIYYNRIWH